MTRATDVLVVGGGVIGSAVAYYLAKEGVEVGLIERGDIASGTSSACDGNVLCTDKKPGYDSQLTLKSQQLLAQLVDELDYDLDYAQRGSVLVVEDETQEKAARDWVKQQKDAGLPMRYIEGNAVFEDEPLLARDVVGLVECASDSSLNPMALVYGFVEAAKRNKAAVHSQTEVTALLQNDSGAICGAATSSGEMLAPKVVLACGVWTPQIARTASVTVPIKPRKGHILVAERTPKRARRKLQEFGYLMAKFGEKRDVEPDMETYGVAMVYEPTEHGNFLIGSSREFVGFDTRSDLQVLRLMAKRALRFFPAIKNINVIRSYAGLRPWTPDHFPIVSPVPSVPGLYITAGHEGDGIGLAPITGKVITEMIVGKSTSVPVEPLRFDRFKQENQLH